MATPDFSKIWGKNSPLAPYTFTDDHYLTGWNFIGSTPPARTMFDAWMRSADEKLLWLYENAFSENSLGGFLFWRLPNTAYFVGEKRALQDGPLDIYLECTVAGKTATTELKKLPAGTDVGNTLKDGNVTWIVRKFADVNLLTEHNIDPDAHPNLGLYLRRNSTAYAVGDIAYCRSLPSWARLECVKSGTTAGSMPNLAVSQCGVMITDGSVVWIVDDLRDGTPVGMVRGSLYVPAGYVKANGAVVHRADYPRLVALADRYRLWTSDVPRDPGLFGRADGSTMMVLPNWIDRMVQLSECNNGTEYGKRIDAGLPNIMGTFAFQDDNAVQSQGYGFARVHSATGAFRGVKRESWHRMLSANAITDEEGDSSIEFNASKSNSIYGRSNTVQPSAIQLIPIIKY